MTGCAASSQDLVCGKRRSSRLTKTEGDDADETLKKDKYERYHKGDIFPPRVLESAAPSYIYEDISTGQYQNSLPMNGTLAIENVCQGQKIRDLTQDPDHGAGA